MEYVPDNYDMWLEHEARQAREIEKLPVCDFCGEPICDGYYYEIDHDKICLGCLDYHYRKEVEV